MSQFASTLYAQTNPTSVVLLEFRQTLNRYVDKRLCLSHYIEYVTYGEIREWPPSHVDHARRVLTRLASLSG